MKKLLFILMIGTLFAQYLPPQSDIAKMSSTEKLMLYNMNEKSPAILAFSNYIWNLELGYKFAYLAKLKNPNIITVFIY